MAKQVFDLKAMIGADLQNDPVMEIDTISRKIEIYQNGLLHCTEGPAVIRANGELQWYFNGLLLDRFKAMVSVRQEASDWRTGSRMVARMPRMVGRRQTT